MAKKSEKQFSWQRLCLLLVFALAGYGLATQIGGFRASLSSLRHAKPIWLSLALLLSLLSYSLAAKVYLFLAKHSLRYMPTVTVQFASNFANRLLPAGVGALAVNYNYLRHCKHSQGQASAVVTMNNALGFVGNMLLVGLFVATTHVGPKKLHLPHVSIWLLMTTAVVVSVMALFVYRRFRRRLRRMAASFVSTVISYRKQPWKVVLALLASMALTLCYSLCLLVCARAVLIQIGLPALFISMTIGVAGATVTPTPGGLGGAEAALIAALLVYGASRPSALAAVLLYRIFTFWLPLVTGGLAFGYARKQRYI